MVGKWKRWIEPLDSTEHPLHAWPLHHTFWKHVKNPPKIRLKKILKLTVHSYACNSLTNFECVSIATSPETGNVVIGTEKNLWNHVRRIYFGRVSVAWNHCASASDRRPRPPHLPLFTAWWADHWPQLQINHGTSNSLRGFNVRK
jgi:hypothetical protein